MPKQRKKQTRKLRKRILIVCEGSKTEPNYFNGFRTDKELNLSAVEIEILDTPISSPKELVVEAKMKMKEEKQKNPYDSVWVVFDHDHHPNISDAFHQATANGIKIAFSNICFEFWFFLHFNYSTRQFNSCGELISEQLKSKIPDYEKRTDYYDFLKERRDDALNNAKILREHHEKVNLDGQPKHERNPYTDVDILVDELLKEKKNK